MTECSPEDAAKYLDALEENSTYCNHAEIENKIIITGRPQKLIVPGAENEKLSPVLIQGLDVKKVNLSLLINKGKRKGEVHLRSGINWGQRDNRNRNEAYISIPKEIYSTDFFPERGVHFTVITDDDKSLTLSRGQENGKGLSTPDKNSLLGEYLRGRLGLSNGALVTKEDFNRYGRDYVTFYKIDDEQYFMDFSQPDGD